LSRCSTKKSVGVPFNGIVKGGCIEEVGYFDIEEAGYSDDVELVRKEERDRKIYYKYYMY
jgi:hypothetical protein